MRRLVSLVLGFTLLLTGCSGGRTVAEPIGDGFSCTVRATYRDLRIVGELTRTGVDMLTLTFEQPSTLKGVTARWDGETVSLSLHGMSFSVDPASVPESALGEEIIAAFDAALRGEGERSAEDGKLMVSGQGKNGAYTLTFDAASGEPLSLSVPSLPLEAKFENFSKK